MWELSHPGLAKVNLWEFVALPAFPGMRFKAFSSDTDCCNLGVDTLKPWEFTWQYRYYNIIIIITIIMMLLSLSFIWGSQIL